MWSQQNPLQACSHDVDTVYRRLPPYTVYLCNMTNCIVVYASVWHFQLILYYTRFVFCSGANHIIGEATRPTQSPSLTYMNNVRGLPWLKCLNRFTRTRRNWREENGPQTDNLAFQNREITFIKYYVYISGTAAKVKPSACVGPLAITKLQEISILEFIWTTGLNIREHSVVWLSRGTWRQ